MKIKTIGKYASVLVIAAMFFLPTVIADLNKETVTTKPVAMAEKQLSPLGEGQNYNVYRYYLYSNQSEAHLYPTWIWSTCERYENGDIKKVWFNEKYYFDNADHWQNMTVTWDIWGETCYGHPGYWTPFNCSPTVCMDCHWWGDMYKWIMVNVGLGPTDPDVTIFYTVHLYATQYLDQQPPRYYSWWYYQDGGGGSHTYPLLNPSEIACLPPGQIQQQGSQVGGQQQQLVR